MTLSWEFTLSIGIALGWAMARFAEGQNDKAISALVGGIVFAAFLAKLVEMRKNRP
jgi:hypothetical protein